jgi:hypothetical protein
MSVPHDRTSRPWPQILAAFLGFLLYAPTIPGAYIYDDLAILRADPRLEDLSRWDEYWTDSYNHGIDNLYRPLVSMTYAVQWLVHGHRPWAFHLVNVVLYSAACWLVAALGHRMLGRSGAWIAGLLFAAHPIHVEGVANIIGRAEILCLIGFAGSLLLFWDQQPTVRRSMGVFAFFVLALLSKEQGMLLPLLLLVADRLRAGWGPPVVLDRTARRGRTVLVLLICWGLASYIVFRESILKFWWDRSFLDWTINPMVRAEGLDRWLGPVALLGRYAVHLLAPVRLSPDYGAVVIMPTTRPDDPYLWTGFAALLAWGSLLGLAFARRDRVATFCLVACAVTLGLVLNLVTIIGTAYGERLAFTPSLFVVLLITRGFLMVPRRVAAILVGVLLVLGSVRTVTYARKWNDPLSFYEWCVAEQPGSVRLRMLLTGALADAGRLDDARAMIRSARELLPNYDELWIQSADIEIKAGDLDAAERYLTHAMQMNPRLKTESWLRRVGELRSASTQPTTNPAR